MSQRSAPAIFSFTVVTSLPCILISLGIDKLTRRRGRTGRPESSRHCKRSNSTYICCVRSFRVPSVLAREKENKPVDTSEGFGKKSFRDLSAFRDYLPRSLPTDTHASVHATATENAFLAADFFSVLISKYPRGVSPGFRCDCVEPSNPVIAGTRSPALAGSLCHRMRRNRKEVQPGDKNLQPDAPATYRRARYDVT